MDGLITLLAICGVLLAAGALIGLTDRSNFSPKWLLGAALLVSLNDFLLTRGYGLLPHLLTSASRNWQGQSLAFAATLVICALPAFGWKQTGLTVSQRRGSLTAAATVSLLYAVFILSLALAFPNDKVTSEEVAFQVSLPGLQEESFYRGLLLLSVERAFRGRLRFFGVNWSWGAVLSSLLFGVAHAFGYADDTFSFEPLIMALTAGPALVLVWLRLRTGSLLLPVLLHNLGNTVTLFV